jgi:hypothetical protein
VISEGDLPQSVIARWEAVSARESPAVRNVWTMDWIGGGRGRFKVGEFFVDIEGRWVIPVRLFIANVFSSLA